MRYRWADVSLPDNTMRRVYVIAETEDRLLLGLEPREGGILVHHFSRTDAQVIPREEARSLRDTATYLRRWWSWMNYHANYLRMNLNLF